MPDKTGIKESNSEVYDVMDTMDYLKFTLGYARDYNNDNYRNMLDYFGMKDAYGNGTANNYNNYLNTPIHNWQKDLLKTAITHSHNITLTYFVGKTEGKRGEPSRYIMQLIYGNANVEERTLLSNLSFPAETSVEKIRFIYVNGRVST